MTMDQIEYAKYLLDAMIDILTYTSCQHLKERFSYLKDNVLFYQIQSDCYEEIAFRTETIFTHRSREARLIGRTLYCYFPPEKINGQYEELKSIILLSQKPEKQMSHIIIHELVHLLSSDRYQVNHDILTKEVGINTYIYQRYQEEYIKKHIIYDITNELLTDYIANILNKKITGRVISKEHRCFSGLSFDNFMDNQLKKKHISLEILIQKYLENDKDFIQELLDHELEQFEQKCLFLFRQHRPI